MKIFLYITIGPFLLLCLYVFPYFLMSTSTTNAGYFGIVTFRVFPNNLPYRVWYPLGWIEARWRGNTVCLNDESDKNPIMIFYTL